MQDSALKRLTQKQAVLAFKQCGYALLLAFVSFMRLSGATQELYNGGVVVVWY